MRGESQPNCIKLQALHGTIQGLKRQDLAARAAGHVAHLVLAAAACIVVSGKLTEGLLRAQGIIFCSISEAVREYPDLVRKHLGSVVRAPVLDFNPLACTPGEGGMSLPARSHSRAAKARLFT